MRCRRGGGGGFCWIIVFEPCGFPKGWLAFVSVGQSCCSKSDKAGKYTASRSQNRNRVHCIVVSLSIILVVGGALPRVLADYGYLRLLVELPLWEHIRDTAAKLGMQPSLQAVQNGHKRDPAGRLGICAILLVFLHRGILSRMECISR